MKKSIFIVFTLVIAVMFGSAATTEAKKKQPPPVQPLLLEGENIINACMKTKNGQLRIVRAGTTCLPSETAVSWNAVGPAGPEGPAGPQGIQGPSGAVATGTVSGAVGTVPGNSTAWAFAGPTVSMTTTTATQRITGAIQASLGTTLAGIASFNYDLCYRTSGTSDALASFAGVNSSGGEVTSAAVVPFPAIASVVPGIGTWEVGYCLLNSGTVDLDNNDFANGWIIVTE
jgi:hypothetical protein